MPQNKFEQLNHILSEMDSVLVAFSGGVDSTLLLKTALDVLGQDKVIAVTASSETYPEEEKRHAKKLAASIGAHHINIVTEELKSDIFANNPPDRCYHCKQELYSKLLALAEEKNLRYVIDGANADDALDFRPGMKASEELGVRSPLREAGLTKKEIREKALVLGLPNWNKPSMPCLSSRFPYGHRISIEKLNQVEKGEDFLRSMGFTECRLRHHGDTARIEVLPGDIEKLAASPLREQIVGALTELGFTYITLDLKGFRSGSMNEVLSKEIKNEQGKLA